MKIRVIRMTADDDVARVRFLRVDTVGLERVLDTPVPSDLGGESGRRSYYHTVIGKRMNNRARRRHLLPANVVVLTHRKRPIDTAFMTSPRDR